MSVMFATSITVSAQTARDYFNELKAARAFNQYKDEYVCFRDDDVPSFAVAARASTIIRRMKDVGHNPSKELLASKDDIFVQLYSKGVSLNDGEVYEHVDKTESDYELIFMKPIHGRIVYSFNWLTGRYLYALFNLDKSKDLPVGRSSGKCELIHPGT